MEPWYEKPVIPRRQSKLLLPNASIQKFWIWSLLLGALIFVCDESQNKKQESWKILLLHTIFAKRDAATVHSIVNIEFAPIMFHQVHSFLHSRTCGNGMTPSGLWLAVTFHIISTPQEKSSQNVGFQSSNPRHRSKTIFICTKREVGNKWEDNDPND